MALRSAIEPFTGRYNEGYESSLHSAENNPMAERRVTLYRVNSIDTCQVRLDGQPSSMVVFVLFPLINHRWSCPHRTHLSIQNIEKLREFIRTRISYESTSTGLMGSARQRFIPNDSRIQVELGHHAILCHEVLLLLLRTEVHRANFQHLEPLAILADELLSEQDRSRKDLFDLWPSNVDDAQRKRTALQDVKDVRDLQGKSDPV